MRVTLLLSLVLIATGCSSDKPAGLTPSENTPPLTGDVRSLHEPPAQTPHGPMVDGLSVGIWSEEEKYELNTRMNVWKILRNTKQDSSRREVAYDIAIHDQDFLLITGPNDNVAKIRGHHPGDGMQGMGFMGGISGILHEHIRRPGTYTLQWKVGELESNVVTIQVREPPIK